MTRKIMTQKTPIHSFVAAKTLGELCGWRITNLKTQKILYFAHMYHMGNHGGERLIDEQFQAWAYGPVLPELYHKLKRFGAREIKDVFWGDKILSRETSPNAYDILEKMAELSPDIESSTLISITHRIGSAWSKVYTPKVDGVPIRDDHILEEYKQLFSEDA